MVKLDIDRSDIVLDPAIIFIQETSNRGQEDSQAGEETKEAVPGSEMFLPSDLLVQIDRAEAPGCGQHGEEVEDPEVMAVEKKMDKIKIIRYQCSWTLSDLSEL